MVDAKANNKNSTSEYLPRLLIVMGVSGSGKSTVAEALAKTMQYQYLDADDFHTPEAKAMMAQGQPLDESMRMPWIDSMIQFFISCQRKSKKNNESYVLAYSGLKQHHREMFRSLPYAINFIYLSGSKSLIAERLTQRKDHFFDINLLDSQFSALEEPTKSELREDTITVNVDNSLLNQQAYILDKLAVPMNE